MPTRSFPVGASSERAEGEGVMRKKIGRAHEKMPRQVETLLNSRGGWEDSPGRCGRAFQTSQDKITGSNSFAHVASSGTAASAGAFERAAMTSPTIFARCAEEHSRKRLR